MDAGHKGVFRTPLPLGMDNRVYFGDREGREESMGVLGTVPGSVAAGPRPVLPCASRFPAGWRRGPGRSQSRRRSAPVLPS